MAHYFMVNHDKRFVAIASPKCASTAVRRWFLHTAGVDPAPLTAITPYLVDGNLLPALGAYVSIISVCDPRRRRVGLYWTSKCTISRTSSAWRSRGQAR